MHVIHQVFANTKNINRDYTANLEHKKGNGNDTNLPLAISVISDLFDRSLQAQIEDQLFETTLRSDHQKQHIPDYEKKNKLIHPDVLTTKSDCLILVPADHREFIPSHPSTADATSVSQLKQSIDIIRPHCKLIDDTANMPLPLVDKKYRHQRKIRFPRQGNKLPWEKDGPSPTENPSDELENTRNNNNTDTVQLPTIQTKSYQFDQISPRLSETPNIFSIPSPLNPIEMDQTITMTSVHPSKKSQYRYHGAKEPPIQPLGQMLPCIEAKSNEQKHLSYGQNVYLQFLSSWTLESVVNLPNLKIAKRKLTDLQLGKAYEGLLVQEKTLILSSGFKLEGNQQNVNQPMSNQCVIDSDQLYELAKWRLELKFCHTHLRVLEKHSGTNVEFSRALVDFVDCMKRQESSDLKNSRNIYKIANDQSIGDDNDVSVDSTALILISPFLHHSPTVTFWFIEWLHRQVVIQNLQFNLTPFATTWIKIFVTFSNLLVDEFATLDSHLISVASQFLWEIYKKLQAVPHILIRDYRQELGRGNWFNLTAKKITFQHNESHLAEIEHCLEDQSKKNTQSNTITQDQIIFEHALMNTVTNSLESLHSNRSQPFNFANNQKGRCKDQSVVKDQWQVNSIPQLLYSPPILSSFLIILSYLPKESEHVNFYREAVHSFLINHHAKKRLFSPRRLFGVVPYIMKMGYVEQAIQILSFIEHVEFHFNNFKWELHACQFLKQGGFYDLILLFVQAMVQVEKHVSTPDLLPIVALASNMTKQWKTAIVWWEKSMSQWIGLKNLPKMYDRICEKSLEMLFKQLKEHAQLNEGSSCQEDMSECATNGGRVITSIISMKNVRQWIEETFDLFGVLLEDSQCKRIAQTCLEGDFDKVFQCIELKKLLTSRSSNILPSIYSMILTASIKQDKTQEVLDKFVQILKEGQMNSPSYLESFVNDTLALISKFPKVSGHKLNYGPLLKWIMSIKAKPDDHGDGMSQIHQIQSENDVNRVMLSKLKQTHEFPYIRISAVNLNIMLIMAGYQGNVTMCNQILNRMVKQYQFDSGNPLPYDSLWCEPFVRAYAQQGQIDDLYALFALLKQHAQPDDRQLAWMVALKAVIISGNPENSILLLMDIYRRHVDAVVRTWSGAYSMVIRLLVKCSQVEKAFKVYGLMKKDGFDLRDLSLINTLISHYRVNSTNILSNQDSVVLDADQKRYSSEGKCIENYSMLERTLIINLQDISPTLDPGPPLSKNTPGHQIRKRTRRAKRNFRNRILMQLEEKNVDIIATSS